MLDCFFTRTLAPIARIRNATITPLRIKSHFAAGLSLLLFGGTVCCAQTTITASIENAKKTIAPIVCEVRDAATGENMIRFRIIGTAFMVEKSGTFVTATHVIKDLVTPPLKDVCRPVITFPIGGWRRDNPKAILTVTWFYFNASDCPINVDFDVAVCRTATDLSNETRISFELATISKERPPDGTVVFFTGFPLQATDPITSVGSIAGYAQEDAYSTIIVDKNAWPGASGSPIYLSDGKTVVGMVVRTGAGEAAGLTLGIAGEKITDVLADAKAYWEKKKNTQPSP